MSKQQRTFARVLRDRLSIREHIAPRDTLSDYMTVYHCYMSEDYFGAIAGVFCALLSPI